VIDKPSSGNAFVYPEPVTGRDARLAIYMNEIGVANVLIFNSVGEVSAKLQEVLGQGLQTIPLNLSTFAPGVYFFQISMQYSSGDTELVSAGKFVVVR
jgi:hypothetical protein